VFEGLEALKQVAKAIAIAKAKQKSYGLLSMSEKMVSKSVFFSVRESKVRRDSYWDFG